jgi:hypothetical protein
MTNDQIAAKLDELGYKLDSEFAKVDVRLSSLEKHSVTRSDVHAAVFQGLAFAAAAIVGTVVVLNALGAFP